MLYKTNTRANVLNPVWHIKYQIVLKIVLANVLYSKPRYIDHELPQYYGTYNAYVKAPSHLSEVLRTFLHYYCGVTNEGTYTVTDKELSEESIKQYLGYNK